VTAVHVALAGGFGPLLTSRSTGHRPCSKNSGKVLQFDHFQPRGPFPHLVGVRPRRPEWVTRPIQEGIERLHASGSVDEPF
jgi:hypothetical protein